MAEVQKHGFAFENWVKTIFKVAHLVSKYTQEWDIAGKIPVSIKTAGFRNALEFGSTVRIWSATKPFLLIVGRWKQNGNAKNIISIDEIKITPVLLKKMKGNISLSEIKEFDKKIKSFPAGKEGQKQGIKFATEWKKARADRLGLLTITHKIDSKTQRRIQCNLNYKNYVKLFGEPCNKINLRGKKFDIEMNFGPRTFKSKLNPKI